MGLSDVVIAAFAQEKARIVLLIAFRCTGILSTYVKHCLEFSAHVKQWFEYALVLWKDECSGTLKGIFSFCLNRPYNVEKAHNFESSGISVVVLLEGVESSIF